MKNLNYFTTRTRWFVILLNLGLLLTSFCAFSQTTIKGTVTDSDGQPIGGVSVYIENTQIGTSTDFDGNFTLTADLTGDFALVISSVGFSTQKLNLSSNGSQTISQKVVLVEDALGLDEIVITGNVNPKSKLESSISTSTVGLAQIQTSGARSTAELYKTIPGIFVNASGGEGNANFEIRGNPNNGGGKFVQVQEDGLPVLPYSDLMFGNVDMFTRLDNTVDRVEIVRGGSAAILGSNSANGIINNISKTGLVEGGSLSQEVGLDYSHFRTDFEYGAPITESLRFHVGGFYRTNEGVRPSGYTANQGSQIKFNITKEFENGYVRLYIKNLDDNTIPYIPIPLARDGDPNSDKVEVTSLPGFSGTHGTFHSVDLLRFKASTPVGGLVEESLEGGMEPRLFAYGAEAKFDLKNNWSFTGKFRKSEIDHEFNGIFSFSGAPQSAADFATSRGVANPGYSYETGVNAGNTLSSAELANLNGNGLVVEYGYWNVDLPMDFFVNDLSVNKRFEDINANLTLGFFRSQFNIEGEWWWHNFLADVSDNTRRLNLTDLDSGESLTVDGFSQFGTLYKNYQAESNINAPYVNFEFSPSDKINFDIGARWDIGSIVGQTNIGSGSSFDYDVDQDGVITAAERGVLYNDGEFIPFDFDYNSFSYSLGVNYKLTDNFASFFRHSKGTRYNFDRAFAFSDPSSNNSDGFPTTEEDGERSIQYELGLKYKSPSFGLFLTGFHTRYPDDQFQELVSDNAGGFTTINSAGLIKVTGIEIEGKWVLDQFKIGFNGTFFSRIYGDRVRALDATTSVDLTGEDTPGVKSFFTISPEYITKNGKYFAGINWIWRGKLDNSDIDDTFFPSYSNVNAFVGVNLSKSLTLGITGSNIFNVLGIDEGNPRSTASPLGQNVVFARPLLGRSWQSRLTFKF